MEPEGSVPISQVPATCPYSEPDQSSPHPQIHFWKFILTHCGRVTQISVFTLQLCKTDDANLRF